MSRLQFSYRQQFSQQESFYRSTIRNAKVYCRVQTVKVHILYRRQLLYRLTDIQFGKVTRTSDNRIIQIDSGPQFKSGMHHNHLFQTIVSRSIGSSRGKYLYKSIIGSLYYTSIFLTSVRFMYLQFLISRIVMIKLSPYRPFIAA